MRKTYRELLEELKKLTDDQLDMEVLCADEGVSSLVTHFEVMKENMVDDGGYWSLQTETDKKNDPYNEDVRARKGQLVLMLRLPAM